MVVGDVSHEEAASYGKASWRGDEAAERGGEGRTRRRRNDMGKTGRLADWGTVVEGVE
jgi:hypothetical protein